MGLGVSRRYLPACEIPDVVGPVTAIPLPDGSGSSGERTFPRNSPCDPFHYGQAVGNRGAGGLLWGYHAAYLA